MADSPSIDRPPIYDAVVVGGSFAGIAAALQLARARRQVLVIDAGKPRNRFAHHSHGFLGQDGRRPSDILLDARSQLQRYPSVFFEAAEAREACQAQAGFRICFGTNGEAAAKRIILATGVVDHLPEVPGLSERWGEGVIYCPYCDAYEVADRRFGVLATGQESIHQAELLPDWSAAVTLFTNGAVTLTEDDRAALKHRGVQVVHEPIARILGAGRSVEAVELVDGQTMPLDALFVISRTTLASPLAEQLGCEVEAGPFGPVIKTDAHRETTVAGVYAAGDTARPMHNATWAAADGVTAGIFAHKSLVDSENPYYRPRVADDLKLEMEV